ncbi:MAG: alpha/beta fold hydrolase, partial [Vicinamibacterales bacterium]
GGLSLGGYVALALYRQAPSLFQALILADTRAEADSADARANRTRLIDVVRTRGAAAVADEMLPKLLGAITSATRPDIVERVRALVLGNQSSAIEGALTAMMARPDSTSLLPSITVPTLVLVGDEDVLTPPALSTAMAALVPSAELVVVPQAGHLSNLEQPDAFNAALLRFLERL